LDDADRTGWRSYHLFYHGDRDRLLLDLVRPLVSSLLAGGHVDRFFYVRFSLGGPHVRLRLRPLPGGAATMASEVAAATAAFFARQPSQASLDEAVIRRRNRLILARSPLENDEAVYPDNSLREVPFHPETDRYGGPRLFEHSLDFFVLSSVAALEFLEVHGDEPWPRRLPHVVRLLVRQAWGLARGGEELLRLLQAPIHSWGDSMAPAVARADQVFGRIGQDLIALLAAEVESLSPPAAAAPEVETARRLAWEIREAPEDVRWRIASSQLHMTANRLGIQGAEEVYLARLLWRSIEGLVEGVPDSWTGLRSSLAQSAEIPPHGRLRDLLAPALAKCSTR